MLSRQLPRPRGSRYARADSICGFTNQRGLSPLVSRYVRSRGLDITTSSFRYVLRTRYALSRKSPPHQSLRDSFPSRGNRGRQPSLGGRGTNGVRRWWMRDSSDNLELSNLESESSICGTGRTRHIKPKYFSSGHDFANN